MEDKLQTAVDAFIDKMEKGMADHEDDDDEGKAFFRKSLYDLLSTVIDEAVDHAMDQAAKQFKEAWNRNLGV